MEATNYVYKTKPNFIFLFFMLGGFVFFLFILSLFWPFKFSFYGGGQGTNQIILFVLIVFFVLFSLGCLAMVVGFKSIRLTDSELIICRPLFFYRRRIPLIEIKHANETDASISVSVGLTYEKETIGHKTTLVLTNGKKVTLSSIEIWDYRSLLVKLYKQIRIASDRYHHGHN